MTASLTYNGNASVLYDPAIYIDGSLFDDYAMSYKFTEKLNEVPEFECTLLALSSTQKTATVKYGKSVILKSGDVLLFPKMMIRRCEYTSDYETKIKGWGFTESVLMDATAEVTASAPSSQVGRPQYTGVSVSTIVSEQIAEVSNVSVGTNDNNKIITIRGENDNVLSFLAGCADVSNGDWWSSYGPSPTYENNYFNSSNALISDGYYGRGSDKTSSVEFNISGENQNMNLASREVDRDSLYNYVRCLGYGDGINQLESHAFHATSVRSYLTSELSDTETGSISLNDASDFPDSGSVWVGCEKINYSGKSGNTLTGLTRGVAFLGNVLTAYTHKIYSPICDAQYTTDNPQSDRNGSSINSNGVIKKTITDRTIIDQSALDILAERILLDHMGVKQ